MTYKIEAIEGIGAVFGAKLRQVGVATTDKLLRRTATPAGRRTLAAATGIDDGLILKWANLSDLMRIKGVGEEYSQLLEAAGVDTVKELKMRLAANLRKAMADANAKRKLVRQLPSEKAVAAWIQQAKTMASVLQY